MSGSAGENPRYKIYKKIEVKDGSQKEITIVAGEGNYSNNIRNVTDNIKYTRDAINDGLLRGTIYEVPFEKVRTVLPKDKSFLKNPENTLGNINIDLIVGNSLIDAIATTFDTTYDFTYNFESAAVPSPLPEVKVQGTGSPTNIFGMFRSNPAMQYIFEIYNFLRCYIDMFHDFLSAGFKINEYIKNNFRNYLEATAAELLGNQANDAIGIYSYWIERIDEAIITAGNNISQIRCRMILEEIIDDYISTLKSYDITFIPNTKQEAWVSTAIVPSKGDPAADYTDLNSLIGKLQQNGVEHFFIESASVSIGDKLKDRLQNINFLLSDWDAGSGYTKSPPLQIPFNTGANIFGLYNIQVSNDNKKITIEKETSKEGNKLEFNQGGKWQKLSLNVIAETAGLGKIRGNPETTSEKINALNLIGHAESNERRAMIMSLKTWTDFIQLKILAEIKGKELTKSDRVNIGEIKPVVVISDGLCETTARMLGLNYVIRNDGRRATLYCYDKNAIGLSEDQIAKKRTILYYLKTNIKTIIDYTEKWFASRIRKLLHIHCVTPDPSLFFVSSIYLEIYEINRKKCESILLKMKTRFSSSKEEDKFSPNEIPDSLNDFIEQVTQAESTLSGFLNQIEEFNKGFLKFNNIRARGSKDEFINAYEDVKLQIVNTYKSKTTEDCLKKCIINTLTYLILIKPTSDQFKTTLEGIPKSDEINNLIKNYDEINKNKEYVTYIKNIHQGLIDPNNKVNVKREYSFKSILGNCSQLECQLPPQENLKPVETSGSSSKRSKITGNNNGSAIHRNSTYGEASSSSSSAAVSGSSLSAQQNLQQQQQQEYLGYIYQKIQNNRQEHININIFNNFLEALQENNINIQQTNYKLLADYYQQYINQTTPNSHSSTYGAGSSSSSSAAKSIQHGYGIRKANHKKHVIKTRRAHHKEKRASTRRRKTSRRK